MDKCENEKGADCKTHTNDELKQNLYEDAYTRFVAQNSMTGSGNSGGSDNNILNGNNDQNKAAKYVLPPYLLADIAERNPEKPEFLQTLKKVESGELLKPTTASAVSEGETGNAERQVYDAKGLGFLKGRHARFEGEAATGEREVDNAYDYTGTVRDFYKDVLGRNSIDGNGMKMISTVNYITGMENAFYNGQQMVYGRPGPNSFFDTFVLLDVAGHEITHGVTEKISGMKYWGQAGALNEHLSDVFGELIEQRQKNIKATDAKWLIGDGIWHPWVKGKGLRDMLNPGTAYDDSSVGRDPQPNHIKDYVKTPVDSGGVHYNSGIPNRAFALYARDAGGYAFDVPGKIWYDASQHAGDNPSFAQFAFQTMESAKRLGHADQAGKIERAWTEVGITPNETETDTLTPPKRPGIPVRLQDRLEPAKH